MRGPSQEVPSTHMDVENISGSPTTIIDALPAYVNKEPVEPATHNGWSGNTFGLDTVVLRVKGRRKIHFFKLADVVLFDRIAKWKTEIATVTDAWNAFDNSAYVAHYGLNHSPDAVIKLHFGVSRYDYILKFKISTESKVEAKFASMRKEFELKLLQRGLIIEHEVSIEEPSEMFVKIVTPFSVLCAEAQLMKLKLPLKPDNRYTHRLSLGSTIQSKLPQWLRQRVETLRIVFGLNELDMKSQSAAFKRKDLARFKGGDPQQTASCDIQSSFFRDSHRALLTYNIISHVEMSVQIPGRVGKQKDRRGIDYLLSEGVYTAMFHLHDDELNPNTLREKLRKDWVQKYFQPQPIDDIAAYFGETVGLYFAFIGFYNLWLLISTFLGIIVVLYGLFESYGSGNFDWFSMFDNDLTPFFGLFMSMWAILMPIAWDRQTKYFAWKWATMDYQKEETKRPQYKGELVRRSPITGKMEIVFPKSKRLGRQIFSGIIMVLWILIVCSSIAFQVSIGAYLSPKVDNAIAINLITSLLGLASIVIMKIPFGAIVEVLNEWENYRTKSQYDNALIFKTYIFDFANSYSQLIYYAFVKPNLSYPFLFGISALDETCSKIECASSVTVNLFVIFIGGQIIERFQELAIPLITAKFKQLISAFRLRSRRSEMRRRRTIANSEVMASMATIENPAESIVVLKESDCTLASAAPSLTKLPTTARLPSDISSITRTVVFPPAPVITILPPEKPMVLAPKAVPSAAIAFREKPISMSLQIFQPSSRASSILSINSISPAPAVPRPSFQESLEVPVRRISLSSIGYEEYLADYTADSLPPYYSDDKLNAFGGIRDEYAQKIIQFGYIALFACSFPLAPLFALLNNIYEIRADAFKLLCVYQRPEPFLAQDIGVWGTILRAIAMLSVATNSLLVSFTSPTFDALFAARLGSGMQLAARLGFILAFHYGVFALSQAFKFFMPRTPLAVATAMARAQYLERVHMDKDMEEEDEIFNQDSNQSLNKVRFSEC
ncbi:calcium-activated chloride channel-domain-containing protein [Chytriomyces sp. MP71]|nr:calcium-activated chloride channel-domain-containing protein [Chytriomyces sp. MP71]